MMKKLFSLVLCLCMALSLTGAVAEEWDGNLIRKAVDADGTPYNGGKGYKTGYRLPSTGVEDPRDGSCITGFIPWDVSVLGREANFYYKGIKMTSSYKHIMCYDADFNKVGAIQQPPYTPDGEVACTNIYTVLQPCSTADAQMTVRYIRIGAGEITDSSIVSAEALS